MQPADFQEFADDYSSHFELKRDIIFNASVTGVKLR